MHRSNEKNGNVVYNNDSLELIKVTLNKRRSWLIKKLLGLIYLCIYIGAYNK